MGGCNGALSTQEEGGISGSHSVIGPGAWGLGQGQGKSTPPPFSQISSSQVMLWATLHSVRPRPTAQLSPSLKNTACSLCLSTHTQLG